MERAGEGLAKIMSKVLRRVPSQEIPVLAWPAACGQAVAERTEALHFSEGVLRVAVPDPSWRTQLTELEPRYRRELTLLLGDTSVRRVEFVAAPGGRTDPRSGRTERKRCR